MSLANVKPGKYLANPVRARFGESSQKGTPFIEVEFKLKDTGDSIKWQGYLTEKTKDRTFDVLAMMGWDGDVASFDSIDTSSEVSLVLVLEPGKDKQGNPREFLKVAFVNDPKGKFENMDAATVKAKLGGINLQAEMAAAKARMGVKPKEDKKVDVPF